MRTGQTRHTRLAATAATALTAARRTVLAGFAVALSFGVAADAWAQYSAQIPGCDRVRGRAQPGVVPGTLLNVITDRNSSVDAIRQVERDCQAIVDQSRGNSVEGLMCVARAQLALADRDENPMSNYATARCRSHRAGYLARGEARTRANALRAEALIGLMRVNAGSADSYAEEIRQVHNRAAPEAVHRAVVGMHLRRGQIPQALTEARSDHLAGTSRALALIDIANERGADSRLLDEAYGADQNSVAVNAALGAAYAKRSEWERARRHLEYATDGRRVEDGYENLQLDAYYYRSIMITSGWGGGTLSQARDYADQAGVSTQALRQRCLVRLTMGGEEIYDVRRNARNEVTEMMESPEGLRACQLGSSPEAPLLEGMFWLRYSQYRAFGAGSSPSTLAYFNPTFGQPGYEPYRRAVRRAEQLFSEGKDRYRNDTRTPLGWPGAEQIARVSQPPIRLRDMYGFADDLAVFFLEGCRESMDSTREESETEDLFVHYKIVGRRGAPFRCQPPN